jgi:ABC-type multidrug transport system fused ATPase/permease subunit
MIDSGIFFSFKPLFKHQRTELFYFLFWDLFFGASGVFDCLLIPLLQLLTCQNPSETNPITTYLQWLAEKAGIPLNLETILIVYVVLLTLMALLQFWKGLMDAGYQQTFVYQIRRRLFRKIIMADWQLLNNKSKTNHLQVLSKGFPTCPCISFFPKDAFWTHNDCFLCCLGYAGICKIYSLYYFNWNCAFFFCCVNFCLKHFSSVMVCQCI